MPASASIVQGVKTAGHNVFLTGLFDGALEDTGGEVNRQLQMGDKSWTRIPRHSRQWPGTSKHSGML